MSVKIAVLVPIYESSRSVDEKTSLRHLRTHLGDHDIIWVAPEGLEFETCRFQVRRFPREYFSGVGSYSKLLISPMIYEAFADYDFVLIYQLDCLVFRDEIERWAEAGYDYIGAPLFIDKTDPSKGFSRVGNGGFSLRRVESFLKVLHSRGRPGWTEALALSLPDLGKFPPPYRWLKKLHVIRGARRGVDWYRQNYGLNEDLFWSDRAKLFAPSFRIAPVAAALDFAFEQEPRYCFAQNGGRIPFGAHAWAKWDRSFWEPHLL